MSKKKFYIPTSIVYTNQKPHIGFALEVIQADVLARYHRLLGEEVFFLTGTDENGMKNVQAAKEAGKTPEKFTEEISQEVQNLTKVLNLSNDDFIRTTDKKRHWPAVERIWLKLKENGDIYKKKYKGLYCVGCETFVKEKDLVDGKCPIHERIPEVIEEENYFFRLSKYQDQLKKIIGTEKIKIIPESRKHELLSFINQGLEDTSCSRSREKLEWGIPVPDDETQRVYVWLEALVNYLSALDYATNGDKFKKFWPPDVHCIGKDIFIRFHGSLWPAMLLSLELDLPKTIFVHGFITSEGQKMSKSLGNVIDPFELVKKYGTDPVRYFLLREIPSTEDGDFTEQRFEERYQADLANGLGNLVARILTLVEKYHQPTKKSAKNADSWEVSNVVQDSGLSPCFEYSGSEKFVKSFSVDSQKALEVRGIEPPDSWVIIRSPHHATPRAFLLYHKKYEKALEEFKFHEALEAVWQLISFCDEKIEKTKPWTLIENEPAKFEKVLAELLAALEEIAILLKPFLPTTSEKILDQIKAGRKGEILFPRLNIFDFKYK